MSLKRGNVLTQGMLIVQSFDPPDTLVKKVSQDTEENGFREQAFVFERSSLRPSYQ